jgi:hypothetical protein
MNKFTAAQKKMLAAFVIAPDGATVIRVSSSIGAQSTAFALRRMGVIRDERCANAFGGVRWVRV